MLCSIFGGKNTPGFPTCKMERKLKGFEMETIVKPKTLGRWICSHEKSQKNNSTTSVQNSKTNLMKLTLF